jgi:predicted dehydrogenase
VFDLPDVDAVVISTTTNTHAPLTIKAIQKGKVSAAAAAACPC